MRTSVKDILPAKVRRSMTILGENIAVARRRRRLTTAMMAERMGVARSTYGRGRGGSLRMANVGKALGMTARDLDAFADAFEHRERDVARRRSP
jgi:transcriptional regulator with XRE-family HTH domain